MIIVLALLVAALLAVGVVSLLARQQSRRLQRPEPGPASDKTRKG